MPAGSRIPPGLPKEFSSADKPYALYEDIEYGEYWDDPVQSQQDALEQHLVSDFIAPRGNRIIDIGCGYGRLAPCYIDRFDQAVLFDGSMSLLRQAQESLGTRVTIVAGDVGHLPFKSGSFDNALSIRVLQHVHDLGGTISEMHRVLCRGGRFVFSYHNKRNANRVLRYLKSRKIADPFSHESAEVSPTLISHHPDRFSETLASAGFASPEYRGAVVVGGIARITRGLGRTKPSGLKWASFAGRHRLAPWLLGSTSAETGDVLRQAGSIDDLFACPTCRGDLARSAESFECTACETSFPIREGIADFRL